MTEKISFRRLADRNDKEAKKIMEKIASSPRHGGASRNDKKGSGLQ
jgi:hypothetical protein